MPLPQRRSAKPTNSRKRPEEESRASSLFLPREIPTYEALQEYSRRIPDLDPDSLTAHLSLLHVVGRMLSMADTYFSSHGLSRGRFSVLVGLFFLGPGGMSPSELAEQTSVTRATMTGLLDGLEREGLVRREKSEGDRRRLLVRLTPRGEEVLRDFLPAHFQRVTRLMGRLTREEKQTLVRLLGKVREGLPAVDELGDAG